MPEAIEISDTWTLGDTIENVFEYEFGHIGNHLGPRTALWEPFVQWIKDRKGLDYSGCAIARPGELVKFDVDYDYDDSIDEAEGIWWLDAYRHLELNPSATLEEIKAALPPPFEF